jgi:hypothetical protein
VTPVNHLNQKELIELLNKSWMTHDAMWFYHCVQEFGVGKANRLNHAAIKSLAPIEVKRIQKALGLEKEKIETFEEFKEFFSGASELCIPDFMNATMSFPDKNILHWEFKPLKCFAYKGMENIGVIDRYECGVIYRVGCWIDSLGIKYRIHPQITKCLMLADGNCSGYFKLDLK